MHALRSTNAPEHQAQQRFERAVSVTFRDPQAASSAEERAALAALLEGIPTGRRDKLIQIRVIENERRADNKADQLPARSRRRPLERKAHLYVHIMIRGDIPSRE